MTIEKLVHELQSYPKGTEVILYDWRKNLHFDDGNGSGEGIYHSFELELIENEARANSSFLAIGFVNDDYNADGQKIEFE